MTKQSIELIERSISEQVRFRLGTADDVREAVYLNQVLSIETDDGGLREEAVVSGLMTAQRNPAGSNVWWFVADLENRIIGTGEYKELPETWRGCAPYAYIDNVVIHPDFRGMGIGSHFEEFLLQFAQDRGTTIARLITSSANTAGEHFWASMRWNRKGTLWQKVL